jgi:hypothetical protein
MMLQCISLAYVDCGNVRNLSQAAMGPCLKLCHVPATGGDVIVSAADLEVFLREWFLRDPDLAKKHAPNRAVNGLLPKAYWVSKLTVQASAVPCWLLSCWAEAEDRGVSPINQAWHALHSCRAQDKEVQPWARQSVSASSGQGVVHRIYPPP